MASKKVKAGETGFSYIDANGDLMMDAPVNEVQITSSSDLTKLGAAFICAETSAI